MLAPDATRLQNRPYSLFCDLGRCEGNHVQIGSTICDSFDEPKRLTKLFADLLGCGCEWLTRAGAE